jgi:hypothetical protein
MMTETTERPALLDIDVVDYASDVAHMAAYSQIAKVAGIEADEDQDKQRWYSLYKIPTKEEQIQRPWYKFFQKDPEEDLDDRAEDLYQLAKYVCHRPENVSGEQLWRKAAELKLHDQPADSYHEQAFEICLAYKLFARVCRLVFIEIEMEQREISAKLRNAKASERQPIPEDDRAITMEEGPLAKDPVYAAAADAVRSVPVAKAPVSNSAPDPIDDQDNQPMSIGERPVQHQGKPQRGGARTPKKDKN